MSLDLTQNLILYLSILSILIILVLFIRTRNLSKSQKNAYKILRRLKYEINKIQIIDSHIAQSITDAETINSWFEEDRLKKEQKLKERQLKKDNRKKRYLIFRNKLPENIDMYAGLKILDKLGIASFLIGLAFFVNISMDLQWINSFGRLFFGILLTIILLTTGYLIRNKYVHFSNIIIGGGIGAFIFTMFAAFYQYHIVSLTLWYLITILIIASAILISISIKRHEIALITFIAAYVAPFSVSFLGTDYIILFSYVTILNIGIIIYDYFQKSIVINILSYGFTFIIYGVWLLTLIYIQKAEVPFLGAFIFLTLFYILFLVIILINNVKLGHEFRKIEFSVMMSAKAIYLSVGIIIINQAQVDFQGLFMGLIALINYSFFLFLYRKKNFDRRILNLFLALAIMFSILIIPVEFYGKTLTLIWSLQAFVLMFISVKSKLDSMRTSSFLLTLGMIGSLFYDMYDQYLSTTGSIDYVKPFLNESFLTSIISVLSIGLIMFLLSKERHEYFLKKWIKVKHYIAFLAAILVLTVYFSFFLEIKYWAIQKFDSPDTIDTILSVFNFSFLALATIPAWFIKQKPLGIVIVSIGFLASFLFIFHYSYVYTSLRNTFLLSSKVTFDQFAIHFYAMALIAYIQIAALKASTFAFEKGNKLKYVFTAVIIFFILFTFSTENSQIFTVKLYQPHLLIQEIVARLHKFSYSITWAFVSFVLVLLGFWFDSKEIRTNAIIIYFITLIKVFTFDLFTDTKQDMMISFAVLGVILLLSSFIFQLQKDKKQKILSEESEI